MYPLRMTQLSKCLFAYVMNWNAVQSVEIFKNPLPTAPVTNGPRSAHT